MTDYLEEYKRALRRGDAEEANKIYREHLRGNNGSEESGQEEETSESEEEEEGRVEKLEDPAEMNIGEVKDYVGDDVELAEKVLELELEGKGRKTLVEYLEKLLE